MNTETQRPTPETDAKYADVEGLSCLAVIVEMTAFARKLEHERDSMRAEAVKRGAAEWVINPDNGETKFQWKAINP